MLILPFVVPWRRGSIGESAADAVLLSAVMAPALWFVIVRPLRRVFQERGELLRRLFASQEAERNRLARDLHDELGQHLTAMPVGLRAMQDGADSEGTRHRAGELLRLTSHSLKEVRRLASGLRAGVLEDFGLQIAVERLCEDFNKAHGLPVTLTATLTPDRRFGPVLETTVYRLVQESLTNVARHAQARNIDVSLIEEGELMGGSSEDAPGPMVTTHRHGAYRSDFSGNTLHAGPCAGGDHPAAECAGHDRAVRRSGGLLDYRGCKPRRRPSGVSVAA